MPCIVAVVVAHVQGVSFDAVLDHLLQLRAIDAEHLMLFKWLRRLADSSTAPPGSVAVPVELDTSIALDFK